MPIDKVKPLKLEHSSLGGTEIDPFPRETNPAADHLSAKGIAFEGNEVAVISATSGLMSLQDSQVTTPATLKDLAHRLNLKDVDLANLTTGYVLTWNGTTQKLELQPPGALLTSIVQCVTFAKSGNASVGSYLRVGDVTSSSAGWLVRGTAKIVGIHVSAASTVASTTRIQLRRRTAVSTFADITNAFVDIPSGGYKASNDPIAITLNSNDELACYTLSGSTVNTLIVNVFMIPVS